MPFALVGFEKLQYNIKESINTLLDEHSLDTKEPEKSIEKLPDDRRIQCRFLLITSKLLESNFYKVFNPQVVLNAACYYVHQRIAATHRVTSPERSTLFKVLTTSLELDKNNLPTMHQQKRLFEELKKFLVAHVFIDSSPSRGYLPQQHYVIREYSIADDILRLDKMIMDLNVSLMEKAKQDKQCRKPLSKYVAETCFWEQSDSAPSLSITVGDCGVNDNTVCTI